MLTQAERVDTSEIWADLQYHKVLNYLTGTGFLLMDLSGLQWLGAPWLALYTALEYETDGGPLWILHSEGLTGHLYDKALISPRQIFLQFALNWREYASEENLDAVPVNLSGCGEEGKVELRKWASILESMADDSDLWQC